MNNNRIWLSTSLYCQRENWVPLIRNGILPFLNNSNNKQFIRFYRVEFNYLGGENIRLSLFCQSEIKTVLAKKVDEYFNSFFLQWPKRPSSLVMPKNGVFLPYPSNTIQYGLYRLDSKMDMYIGQFLSKILLNALNDEEEINDNTVITLSLYLLLAAITIQQESDELSAFNIDFKDFNYSIPNQALIEEKYESVKTLLSDIYSDIKNRNLNALPVWLRHWMFFCKNRCGLKTVSKRTCYSNILNNIFLQLGFTYGMQILVNYFIRRILQRNT